MLVFGVVRYCGFPAVSFRGVLFGCSQVLLLPPRVFRLHFWWGNGLGGLLAELQVSSDQLTLVICCMYRGLYYPVTYIGVIINDYKDPYETTSIMECQKGFDHCSSGESLSKDCTLLETNNSKSTWKSMGGRFFFGAKCLFRRRGDRWPR